MLKYKIYSNPEILENKKQLMDFYQSGYNFPYWEILKNSTYVCACLDKEKVIGGARLVSDKNRFTLFCDFFVLEEYQNKGVGTGIIKKVTENSKFKVGEILLVTDPKSPWLIDYYKKLGFKIGEGTYMELKK